MCLLSFFIFLSLTWLHVHEDFKVLSDEKSSTFFWWEFYSMLQYEYMLSSMYSCGYVCFLLFFFVCLLEFQFQQTLPSSTKQTNLFSALSEFLSSTVFLVSKWDSGYSCYLMYCSTHGLERFLHPSASSFQNYKKPAESPRPIQPYPQSPLCSHLFIL